MHLRRGMTLAVLIAGAWQFTGVGAVPIAISVLGRTQLDDSFESNLEELQALVPDDWNDRVAKRRAEADRQAIQQAPLSLQRAQQSNEALYDDERANAILKYVESLPPLRQGLIAKAQPEWDTGVTARMVKASYEYIDSLQGVLVTMAAFYPKGNFGCDDPHRYFSEVISSRFAWHRSLAEPDGPGTGGSIIHVTVSGSVVSDVEKMVEDMAVALVGYDDRFDWRVWSSRWNE